MGIYTLTGKFPTDEKFGIISQLRRAALSVPTNIAEGCGHSSERELVRFMDIASGFASEVDYLLYLATELKYINQDEYDRANKELTEIRKMISGYIKTVRNT